jgi:alkanesulfonate monooxygenase SsuD/methylene tetrahydromethanopterin reductase-like flavin-dependent oxidoreductase (luciferase family)
LRKADCDCRVDRVAAALQDFDADPRRARLLACHHAVARDDRRALRDDGRRLRVRRDGRGSDGRAQRNKKTSAIDHAGMATFDRLPARGLRSTQSRHTI